MAKIKIKHFGPITDGFAENDGFINIDKVMIFIGGQGSGKSSIVKLISTISWLEKELYKMPISIEMMVIKFDFVKLCVNQSIQNYFKSITYIEYIGKYLTFKYDSGIVNYYTSKDYKNVKDYKIPKITYIPAERNFLSVLEVSELGRAKELPKSLTWTLDEFLKACRNLINPLTIPINHIEFEYNKENKTTYISGNGFKNLKLSEASSGIQSVVPMIVVLNYLNDFIDNSMLNNIEGRSFNEIEDLKNIEKSITNDTHLSTEEKKEIIDYLPNRLLPQHLFTIIEEIEQNLFPESQKNILFKLLEFNNNKKENHLILTTHSPYIIAYITLAMKAFKVIERAANNKELLDRLSKIVPLEAKINPDQTAIYQIDENGNVLSIKSVRGLIKDDNYLNSSLEETNDMFSELLEIEELCKQ